MGTALTYGLVLQVTQQSSQIGPAVGPMPVLPQSIAAWIALVVSLLALVTVIWRGGRWSQKLESAEANLIGQINGLGQRVQDAEDGLHMAEEREKEWIRIVDKVNANQEALLKEISRAHARSETCEDNTTKFAIEIGSKVDAVQKEVSALALTTGTALQAVKTELELTRRERIRAKADEQRS